MKLRILAVAITFFFGIATSIMISKIGSQNAKVCKVSVDQVHKSTNERLKDTIVQLKE